MSYSTPLGSPITNTHLRNPNHVSDISGMCAVCTADCIGPCEIGLSALRGSEAILPFAADKNQFASEKRYPLDFSHFNINGRVFGAIGLAADPDTACFPNADISSSFGLSRPDPDQGPVHSAGDGETGVAGILRRRSALRRTGRHRRGRRRQGRQILSSTVTGSSKLR